MSIELGVQRARARARRRYRSAGFQNAYVAGARAALRGRPIDDCPYGRKPGWRAWRRAWLSGHASSPAP